jgi:predicted heme/steroid binding protein
VKQAKLKTFNRGEKSYTYCGWCLCMLTARKEVYMNDEYEIRDMLYQFQKEITYYSQMETYAVSQYEKNYNRELMKERTEEIIKVLEKTLQAAQVSPETPSVVSPEIPPEQRIFTLEELEKYDGKNGNPPYVAISGTVYDLSEKIVWSGGTHFGMIAGHDLTMNFMGCHNGMVQILQQLPVVGTLIEST